MFSSVEKLRISAQDTASQATLRNCSKEEKWGARKYIGVFATKTRKLQHQKIIDN